MQHHLVKTISFIGLLALAGAGCLDDGDEPIVLETAGLGSGSGSGYGSGSGSGYGGGGGSSDAGPSPVGCHTDGCSGQLCVPDDSEPVITTCEWKPEYACYDSATCERQPSGGCGWTPSPSLTACLGQ